MPMRIFDGQVRAFTDKLAQSGTPKIDGQNVLELLAGVGDSWTQNAASVLSKLTAPGITRQQQFELAKSGLSFTEKRDLEQVLDQSGFEMDPSAKNFLEALTGRAPLQTTFGPLTITGDQKNGIEGVAKPGEVIEVINLTTAPAGRLHLTDTVELGKADQFGKFQGQLPEMREGDVIRLRTRAADGSTSDWLTIQAKGIEASDTRNAHVNLERMDLSANADGTVSVGHNTDRPITEPDATIRFTNVRTGKAFDVRANENGSIPKDLKLEGQAGDEFKVAVSDGRNNVDFATVAGALKLGGGNSGGGVNLPDPNVLKSDRKPDGSPKFTVTRFTGPLFIDEPTLTDVRQGAIGDCYFPAAMASLAFHTPETIKEMIKENGDGTYTVTFKPRGIPKEIVVDGDLYARSFGGPVYGGSLGGSTAPDKMELWFPLIEKAYAMWKGGADNGYETIGNGGVAGQVMSEVTGRNYDYENISDFNADRIFERILQGGENHTPMAAGTYGKDEAARYTNTGVYANHAYTVMGGEVGADGKKYVNLRNPWGQSEGGNDGKNDGIFKLELSEFVKLYRAVHILD